MRTWHTVAAAAATAAPNTLQIQSRNDAATASWKIHTR